MSDDDPTRNWPLCATCGKSAREGKHCTDLGEGHDYVPAAQAMNTDDLPDDENCNAGPFGPRAFAREVLALIGEREFDGDDWSGQFARLRSELAAVNTHRRAAERARARIVELEQAVSWLRGRVGFLESRIDIVTVLFHAVDLATEYVGCGDNSCLFVKPRGMATNGGCRCVDRGGGRPGVATSMGKLYRAARAVRDVVAAGEANAGIGEVVAPDPGTRDGRRGERS